MDTGCGRKGAGALTTMSAVIAHVCHAAAAPPVSSAVHWKAPTPPDGSLWYGTFLRAMTFAMTLAMTPAATPCSGLGVPGRSHSDQYEVFASFAADCPSLKSPHDAAGAGLHSAKALPCQHGIARCTFDFLL